VSYVVSLLYLAVFGSVIAFGCYLTLIGRIGAHRAGYSVVMFPVVALVLSALFEGLHIDANIVIGVGLALAGNVVILSVAGETKRRGGGKAALAPSSGTGEGKAVPAPFSGRGEGKARARFILRARTRGQEARRDLRAGFRRQLPHRRRSPARRGLRADRSGS
jgi:hypothetical protein